MCLFSWPVQLMCSQGMPAAVGGWVTGIRMEKGGWRKRCLFFHRDRVRGERKTASDFLLQSWAWDWEHRLSGAVGEGWVCLQPYLLPCEGLFLGWQKVPVRAGSWGKATHGRRGLGGGLFVESTGDVGGRKGCSSCSVLRMRMGDLFGQTESKFFIFKTC